MNQIFPFPDRIGSREELRRDIHYRKIAKEDLGRISDRAWETGVHAASELLKKYPGMPVYKVMEEEGLKISRVNQDQVSGNVRYFSEYYSGRKEIILYEKSICLWARENHLSVGKAEEMILAHEFYHHLECTRLGLTSRQYQVPILQLGGWKIGRTGIRSLSEIGAHGFARTIYEALKEAEI